ncbi:peptidoglycan DD-metalloendopeptidase family protein [Paenibacillus septentrionalis]|uniref:Peptidoglycan DD-metalloendopeptidase family protein n=1 Tax=Paenibacillus septentrionalis TaxID=429342 RepID=A0ABW1V844_9BACL
MKQKQRSNWSLLLMRGPDQSVKQFNVTRRSVIAAPVALMAIFSSVVVGLQLKAHSELHRIQQEHKALQLQYSTMIHEHSEELVTKEATISNLAAQLSALQQEQKSVSSKLQELMELEAQLQQFIQTYGEDVPLHLNRETTGRSEQSNSYRQAEGSAAQQRQYEGIAMMAYQSNAPLSQMTRSLESLMTSMEASLDHAHYVKEQIDSYPNHWPAEEQYITSGFGYRSDPFTGQIRFHAGIDIAGSKGDSIFSAADGAIIEAGFESEYGNYVIVEHLHNLRSVYMHLETITVKVGDEVAKGEKLGTMGSSGRSTGTHLHFQIMQHDHAVSPLPFLRNEKIVKEDQHV